MKILTSHDVVFCRFWPTQVVTIGAGISLFYIIGSVFIRRVHMNNSDSKGKIEIIKDILIISSGV